MNIEKIEMKTENLVDKNIEKIADLFPNCITEKEDENGELKKAVNFKILQQMLTEDAIADPEAYEFTWVGKNAAIAEANRPIEKTLRPCKKESVDWEKTENLYIEGENLDVLKLLQKSYLGKVKVIYIDPPYNTGMDFIYPDSFIMSNDDYNDGTGYYDELGNVNYSRKNQKTAGKYHSDWCSMMYSRILLAKNLMRNDGVIFISIDDNELSNLKLICDEIFGYSNFINLVTVNIKNIAGASGGGEDKKLKKNTENVLIYSKDISKLKTFKKVYSYTKLYSLIQEYRLEDKSWKYTTALINPGDKEYLCSTFDSEGDEIKIYQRRNYEMKSVNQIIKSEHISEEEVYKKYGRYMFQTAMPQSSIRPRVINRLKDIIHDNSLISIEYIPKSGKNKGITYEQFYKGDEYRLLAWLKDVTEEINGELYKKDLIGTLWDYVSETKNLTKEGSVKFPNAKKPLKMISDIIYRCSESDDYILDFFSGSSTTAHAVMQLNTSDGGKRKFILVQLPEPCDEITDVKKEKYSTIAEIGKERIRRAGKQIKAEYPLADIDVGFRVLKLDDWNKKDVMRNPSELQQSDLDKFYDATKDDRTDLDLLFGCLIEEGMELTKQIEEETIDGIVTQNYNDGWLIGCFADNVPESVIRKIAERKPRKVVFKDSSFQDSSAKINYAEIFKMISPDTMIKVI